MIWSYLQWMFTRDKICSRICKPLLQPMSPGRSESTSKEMHHFKVFGNLTRVIITCYTWCRWRRLCKGIVHLSGCKSCRKRQQGDIHIPCTRSDEWFSWIGRGSILLCSNDNSVQLCCDDNSDKHRQIAALRLKKVWYMAFSYTCLNELQ